MIDLGGDPPQGPLPKWGGGLVAPLVCVVYALITLVRGEAYLGRHREIALRGTDVVAAAIPVFCLAFLLHAHFFWGNTERLEPYSGLGKTLEAIAFVLSLVFLAIRVLRPM